MCARVNVNVRMARRDKMSLCVCDSKASDFRLKSLSVSVPSSSLVSSFSAPFRHRPLSSGPSNLSLRIVSGYTGLLVIETTGKQLNEGGPPKDIRILPQ